MTSAVRLLSGTLALSLLAGALAGCVPAAPGESLGPADGGATEAVAAFAQATAEEQRARLRQSELALDAYLAAGLGLDETLGTDAATAARELPRILLPADTATVEPAAMSASLLTVPALAASPARAATSAVAGPTQGEALGAAFNAMSVLQDAIRDGLAEAAKSDASVASHDPAAGDNPSFSWAVFDGTLAGNFELTASDVGPNGERYALQLDGEYNLLVCPDMSGATEGYFWVSGSVDITPADGTPTRAAVQLKGDIATQVSDDAYTESIEIESSGDSAFGPPASHPSEVGPGGTTESTSGATTIQYGSGGAADVSSVAFDGGADGDFGAVVDDLVTQMSQLIVRAQEDWFRDSNCVNLQVSAAEYAVQKGETTTLTTEAVSLADGAPFDLGTVRSDGVDGPGTVTPTGEQALDTEFTFEAGDTAGTATAQFTATSRRGIGRNVAPITVIEGWVFDETHEGVRTHAIKCDGLTGPWTMYAEGVGWDYRAVITATFDEELRGSYSITGSSGDYSFDGGGEMWMVPVAGGYDLHASTGENVFHVRGATNGECG